LTLESVYDPNVKAEIWSINNDNDGNPQNYFRIQYQAETMDAPQIYYLESPQCTGWQADKSSVWWEKKAGVTGCPTSGTHADDSFSHLCSGFTSEDDCYSKDASKGGEHACVWNTQNGACEYPEFPNTVLIIFQRMINDDTKVELVNWYSNFDVVSKEHCPAVDDPTIA